MVTLHAAFCPLHFASASADHFFCRFFISRDRCAGVIAAQNALTPEPLGFTSRAAVLLVLRVASVRVPWSRPRGVRPPCDSRELSSVDAGPRPSLASIDSDSTDT